MNKTAVQTDIDSHQKGIRLSEIYPVLSEVLSSGGTFTLTVTGTSMFPTILGGRDRVSLNAAPPKLKKYDLPLYRRRDGSFVLHRIVSIDDDGSYVCCGDHQWGLERGIKHEQIVGLVTQIERKGKTFSVENRKYRRWVTFWTKILPLRHFLFYIQGFFTRLKRLFRKMINKR